MIFPEYTIGKISVPTFPFTTSCLPIRLSLGEFRPQDDDFGIAPSEEWRTMSAPKARNHPNIRRWG
jgi:hypothetical protein